MYKKVVGIFKGDFKRKSIEGQVWIRDNNGVWSCKDKSFTLNDEQIKHDVSWGYSKPVKENNER